VKFRSSSSRSGSHLAVVRRSLVGVSVVAVMLAVALGISSPARSIAQARPLAAQDVAARVTAETGAGLLARDLDRPGLRLRRGQQLRRSWWPALEPSRSWAWRQHLTAVATGSSVQTAASSAFGDATLLRLTGCSWRRGLRRRRQRPDDLVLGFSGPGRACWPPGAGRGNRGNRGNRTRGAAWATGRHRPGGTPGCDGATGANGFQGPAASPTTPTSNSIAPQVVAVGGNDPAAGAPGQLSGFTSSLGTLTALAAGTYSVSFSVSADRAQPDLPRPQRHGGARDDLRVGRGTQPEHRPGHRHPRRGRSVDAHQLGVGECDRASRPPSAARVPM